MSRRKSYRPELDHSVTRVRVHRGCRHPYEPDEPSGYLAWHEWMEEHAKTHTHEQCPKCGLWCICKPKAEASLRVPADSHARASRHAKRTA